MAKVDLKKDKALAAALKDSLTKSDKHFNKKTVDNPQPKKIVTMADIDARNAAKKKATKKK